MSTLDNTAAAPVAGTTPTFIANTAIQARLLKVGASLPEFAKKAKATTEELPELDSEVDEAATDAKSALEEIANDKSAPKTWDNWMKVAKGLFSLQAAAAAEAGGKTIGAKYSKVMNGLLEKYNLHQIDRFTRSKLMACYKDRDAIQKWLDKRNKDKGRVINHPALALEAYKTREGAPKTAKKKTSVTKLVTGLVNRFEISPAKFAGDILSKHCRIGKDQFDADMIKQISDLLEETLHNASESGKTHEGWKYLSKVSHHIFEVANGTESADEVANAGAEPVAAGDKKKRKRSTKKGAVTTLTSEESKVLRSK
jgi:hypothetical protein